MVASMGRRPGLSIYDRNIAFGLLDSGTRVADVARTMNVQFILCNHVFDSLAVKKTDLVLGDNG